MPMALDDALSEKIDRLRRDVVPMPVPPVRALQLGATWNVELARRVGAAFGARYAGQVVGVQLDQALRDPRRGRNELSYAEDPLLAARLAAAHLYGMSRSCMPVITDFDVDTCRGHRYGFNARVANELELPIYRAVFETGGARGVVFPQYLFDQTPTVMRLLVEEGIRPWGGGQVPVFSQGDAGSAVAALKAGADGFIGRDGLTIELTQAVKDGRLTEGDLDQAAARVATLRTQMTTPTADDHEDLTLARESVVLLRNDGLLPLLGGAGVRMALVHPGRVSELPAAIERRVTAAGGTVAVTAGNDQIVLREPESRRCLAAVGDELRMVLDRVEFDATEWTPHVFELSAGRYHRVVEVVPADGATVLLRDLDTGRYLAVRDNTDVVVTTGNAEDAGNFIWETVTEGATLAAAAAAAADVVVVIVGNSPDIDGRGGRDRENLFLPAQQERTLRAVRAANPNTVLTVLSSYPYALDWADGNVGGILWSAPGGPATEIAVAEVLFGDRSPTGRLPQTWYRAADTAFETYLHHRGEPLFAFGHGLTYTTFAYDQPTLSAAQVEAGGRVTVSVRVHNTGYLAGDEVVQLYTRQLTSRVRQPLKQLRHFTRITVPARAARTVTFTLTTDDLSYFDVTSQSWIVEKAEHDVLVGGHAVRLAVRGQELPPRRLLNSTLYATRSDEGSEVVMVDGPAIEAAGQRSWLGYRACDLAGCRTWALLAGNPTAGTRYVGLHLDDQKGPLAGLLAVPPGPVAVHTAPITGETTGIRDVFVVFTQPGVVARHARFS